MKKWFVRFLNIGITAAAMLMACAIALFYWAVPNTRDMALVPMALDAEKQKGAGFLTNATDTPWMVYISAYTNLGRHRPIASSELQRARHGPNRCHRVAHHLR